MDHWFDHLTREAASGLSRRVLLRRLGAGLAGVVMAGLLPRTAWTQPADGCHDFCQENFSGAARGQCVAEAAHGGSLCQACAGDPARLCRPTAQDSPLFDQTLCCAADQACGASGCLGGEARQPLPDNPSFTDTASAGNGGVASASANGGAVAIGDASASGNVGTVAVGDPSSDGNPTATPVSSAASSNAFGVLPSVGVIVTPTATPSGDDQTAAAPTLSSIGGIACPEGTTACGLAGCCPSGTVCTDAGCVRAR